MLVILPLLVPHSVTAPVFSCSPKTVKLNGQLQVNQSVEINCTASFAPKLARMSKANLATANEIARSNKLAALFLFA